MLRSFAPNTRLASLLTLGLTLGLPLSLPLGLGACGGDDGGEGPAGEDESSGDGDPSGDGDGDPTTTGDPTTGDPTTTGDGDGDPTTGDGDGDPTTGDGDGDPMFDDATYTITLMPGPPDRLTIRRISNSEPSCTHMVLVKPGFDSFDITISQGWAIEEALVWRQGFCPMDLSDPDGEPTMGTGSFTFSSYDALMTFPCTIDFDAEINYATDPPSSGTWKKDGVPVTGVNCG